MKTPLPRSLLPALALGLAAVAPLHAAPPRLEQPVISQNQVRLRLGGDPGQTYRLESSADLRTWSTVTTGVAVDGTLTLTDTWAPTAHGRYYRAVTAAATRHFPSVIPSTHPRLVASGVITPEAGGALNLTDLSGRTYSLSIAPKAVLQATVVTITLVTNLAGIPSAGGFLAGVQLEPEGLVLAYPAFLDIGFATPIPARQVSSFAFGNSGAYLHLVPDIVVTNNVRILVNQLRGHGSGVFTEAELINLAATTPPPRGSSRARASLHATIEECYPEDEEAAREMTREIDDAMRPMQQAIAEKLGLERQRQLLGVASEDEGSNALLEVISTSQDFYNRVIASRIPEASQRCATTRALLPYLLGWERQRQLLGAGDEGMDPGVNDLMSAGFRKCEEQALECCRTRGGDTRLIAFLLGIERQRQLLGAGDGQGGIMDQVEACAPKWLGTLTVKETGSYSTNYNNASTINRISESWSYSYEGTVAAVEEQIVEQALFIPAHTNLTFTLAGPMLGSHQFSRHYEELWDACSTQPASPALAGVRPHDGGETRTYIANISATTNAPLEVRIQATLLAPGAAAFGITPALRFTLPGTTVPRTGWIQDVTKSVASNGCDVEDNSGPPRGATTFGNAAFNRGSGQFQYTGDSIKFLRITPRKEGDMVVIQNLELNLYRLK